MNQYTQSPESNQVSARAISDRSAGWLWLFIAAAILAATGSVIALTVGPI